MSVGPKRNRRLCRPLTRTDRNTYGEGVPVGMRVRDGEVEGFRRSTDDSVERGTDVGRQDEVKDYRRERGTRATEVTGQTRRYRVGCENPKRTL